MPKAQNRILSRLASCPERVIPKILCHPKRDELAREFLDQVDAAIDQRPGQGLRLARIAVRLSAGLGSASLARAFGALAHGHRALGRYEKARRALEIAFQTSVDPRDHAVLKRREAHLLCSEERFERATVIAGEAFDLARRISDTDGEGRALMVLGNVQWLTGQKRAAGDSAREALTRLDPQSSARFRRAAHYLVSLSLAHDGQSTDVREALRDLSRVQRSLLGQYGSSQTAERALVKWTKALLHQRLGANARARTLLEKARLAFIRLEMPQEIAAITADLALVVHHDTAEVRRAVRPIGELVRKGGIDFPPEISRRLHALWRSTCTKSEREARNLELRVARHRDVLAAIHDLRELFEGRQGVPALFLPFPESPSAAFNDSTPIGF